MISIRLANEGDVEALYSLDLVARRENKRREFIARSVASGACSVAVDEDEVIGYGVLNYSFYDNGCIDMLYVLQPSAPWCGGGIVTAPRVAMRDFQIVYLDKPLEPGDAVAAR